MSSSDFFQSSSIDKRVEVSQFSMAMLERKTSTQFGEGLYNMGVVLIGHFWQLGSIASLATETTGGD